MILTYVVLMAAEGRKGGGPLSPPPFYSLFHCRDLWTIDRGLLIPHSILLSHKWKQLELIEGWEETFPTVTYHSPPISSAMTTIFGIQRSRSLLSHILGPSYGCMPTHFCTIWVNRAQIFVLLHSTVFAVKAFSLGVPTLLPFFGLRFSCYSRKSRVLPVIFHLFRRYSKSRLPA